MHTNKKDIIAQLQKEILPLQGFKPLYKEITSDYKLGPIRHAFRDGQFPLGAIHEFLCFSEEDTAATTGFTAGLMSSLMKERGTIIWISSIQQIFPPGLISFGITPQNIIFISLKKDRDILWTIEEALKCKGVTAVVGEVQEISFTESRRLQLAVEQSGVTGFIFRRKVLNLDRTASLTRWKVCSMPSECDDGLPGVGFPRWNVDLQKVRNGKPGNWKMEWRSGMFLPISPSISLIREEQKKTG